MSAVWTVKNQTEFINNIRGGPITPFIANLTIPEWKTKRNEIIYEMATIDDMSFVAIAAYFATPTNGFNVKIAKQLFIKHVLDNEMMFRATFKITPPTSSGDSSARLLQQNVAAIRKNMFDHLIADDMQISKIRDSIDLPGIQSLTVIGGIVKHIILNKEQVQIICGITAAPSNRA
jgi:hypothetical protein